MTAALIDIATYRSCMERDGERARRAAEKVLASGGSALEAEHAIVKAVFSQFYQHAELKRRVRKFIRNGAGHPEALRYRQLAQHNPVLGIRDAIYLVGRMLQGERDSQAVAVRIWGHNSRPRVQLMMLEDLRLALRWTSRYAPKEFAKWQAVIGGNQ
jgi:hypothetical protein